MGISTALYNGLSGLNSYATAISVVSDNVANANTTAFKSNSVRFGDLVNSYYASLSDDVEREGAGSTVMGFVSNFGQGTLMGTQSWSDLAMSGEGFFSVRDPVSGNTYYTRDGSFGMEAIDADSAYLVNQQGYRVLDNSGQPITIPLTYTNTNGDTVNYSKFRVGDDGQIYATGESEVTTNMPQVGMTVFTNPNGLIRSGQNLYSEGPDSGTATSYTSTDAAMFGKINDYNLESSNVDLAKEMVDMIIYQASYNANSKTITTNAGLLDTTIAMVR